MLLLCLSSKHQGQYFNEATATFFHIVSNYLPSLTLLLEAVRPLAMVAYWNYRLSKSYNGGDYK